MPDLSMRVVAFYVAVAFPFGLLCSILFFDRPPHLDDEAASRRHLRRARLLVLASPLHVLFPLTATGMVRGLRTGTSDLGRGSDSTGTTVALAAAGVVVSLVVLAAVAVVDR